MTWRFEEKHIEWKRPISHEKNNLKTYSYLYNNHNKLLTKLHITSLVHNNLLCETWNF